MFPLGTTHTIPLPTWKYLDAFLNKSYSARCFHHIYTVESTKAQTYLLWLKVLNFQILLVDYAVSLYRTVQLALSGNIIFLLFSSSISQLLSVIIYMASPVLSVCHET